MSAEAARRLIRRTRSAALATSLKDDDGRAYASLVTVACDADASPLLLLSDLADHTRNLAADARASLLFEAASRKSNPQTGPRVSVLGRITRSEDARHHRRFLARHPQAELYAGFADFHLYRMTVERAHYVGGFARARWMQGEDLRSPAEAAAIIAEGEVAFLCQVNDHHDRLADLLATRLLGRRGAGWMMVGVDPDGCDLKRKNTVARLDFPRLALDLAGLSAVVEELVRKARVIGS